MKKVLLAVFMVLFFTGMAMADCTVTVNLNVSTDPNAALQEIWYDPDNTVADDEIMQANGDMALTQAVFNITAPAANDEVYVITKNATETESYESPHVAVGGIAGSSVSTVIVECN